MRMPDDPKTSHEGDDVDPLTWELTRDERAAKDQPERSHAQPVHTFRPAKSSDRVGAWSATASVIGALAGRGAGHAMPVVLKLGLLVVALVIVGMAVTLLSRRFDTAGQIRKELDAKLVEYRTPLFHAASKLAAEAKVAGRFDTIDYGIDPVIEAMPSTVPVTIYRDLDKLEMALGSGTHAEGMVFLDRREFQLRIVSEGSTLGSGVFKLPEPGDESANP